MKKLISILLVAIMLLSVINITVFAAEAQETVILYTNDVHCAMDDYPVLAAYRAELLAQGKNVITIDAGDAIQGEVIGGLTEGEAIVELMNAVGYDYAVPGNHEFDYGMDTFLDLAQNKAEYDYISTNFYYLPGVRPVFAPYVIEDFGDYQIAFIGISTPETITKSTPEFFKDENKNFIYGFPTWDMQGDVLYENIQESIDSAILEGADIVVAAGHTGILETTDGWKSTDIIANTSGIDYYIDAHSHETIESAVYKNENNEDVILSSTGTKFDSFGVLTINGSNADFELVDPDDVNVEEMSDEAKNAYNTVKGIVDGYNEDIAYLCEEIGTSKAHLVAYDSDGTWAVRKRETNAGDFVADAYRSVTGADVAIANGGGVRAEIEVGNVTRKMLMDMNAFNNDMCVLEVTGSQLLDVLEHGARECPQSLGGFFQVSGMSFEIHAYLESPVICDQLDNFIEIDETKERRVQNVLIGGEPIEADKIYTLAGSTYVLLQGGDGLTMLDGTTVVQKDGLPCDSEMLIKYFTDTLGGNISAEQYGDPDGDGRIKIFNSAPVDVSYDYEISYGETITVSAPVYLNDTVKYIRFIPEESGRYALKSNAPEGIDPICELYDAALETLVSSDDTDDYDFYLKYDFVAGETYYFAVYTYSEEVEIEVSLVCDHNYQDGICILCDTPCDHQPLADFPCLCPCGKVFTGIDIYSGDEIELDAAKYNNDDVYLRFIPQKNGTYVFESVSHSENGDPVCTLYDSTLESINYSDDVNGYDFLIAYELTQGETYYFKVFNNCEDEVCTLKLQHAVHVAEDGTSHDLEYVPEEEASCSQNGYTAGFYCPDCGEYVTGHEETPLNDNHDDCDLDNVCDFCEEYLGCDEHTDNDNDGYCDDCDEELISEETQENDFDIKSMLLSLLMKIILRILNLIIG